MPSALVSSGKVSPEATGVEIGPIWLWPVTMPQLKPVVPSAAGAGYVTAALLPVV